MYTIWRAEISHFKTQHMSYRKTGTEWEILGELAARLHHKEEAKDAFQRCLEAKFSAKALIKLLEMYTLQGDLQRSLNAAIKLTTYHHRWYMDAAYPSLVAHYYYQLGLVHGHAKIQYTLLSMVRLQRMDGARTIQTHQLTNSPQNLPVGIFEIMQGYGKYAATFAVSRAPPRLCVPCNSCQLKPGRGCRLLKPVKVYKYISSIHTVVLAIPHLARPPRSHAANGHSSEGA